MIWEIIGGICAIIGVVYLIYQYHIQPSKVLKDHRDALMVLFFTSQRLIDQLIADLKLYDQKFDGQVTMYNQGFTVHDYKIYLIEMRGRELSETTLNVIKSLPLTQELIADMRNSLQKQIYSFNESQAYLDSTFKYRALRS